MAHRFFYPLCGAILGLSSPFVWLIWCAFSAKKEWWIKWIHTEWSNNSTSYLVIGFVGVALFSLIGYLLAERKSAELDEAESIKDANQQLEELASTDGLTGLFNARYMRERLQVEMANAHRGWLTCLLVDIDHFKKINDQMGHPFGDAVLVHAADLMQSAVRRMDVVGRLGGEEFLVILPEASAERGKEVAERLRLAFEKGHIFGRRKNPARDGECGRGF
jgi:diguanylate cyclase (GGDEF)-like protein